METLTSQSLPAVYIKMPLLPPLKVPILPVSNIYVISLKKYDKVPFPIDNFNLPSRLSLSLIFFAVYLFEMDSIGSYNTIRNYMSQVRQSYLKRGYPEKLLESQLLKTVKKGIKRCMPPKADTRIAFLLVHYSLTRKHFALIIQQEIRLSQP